MYIIFIRCPKNTYGDVCENKPNICRDLSPCLNGATCEEGINTIAKCTCPNGGKIFILIIQTICVKNQIVFL